MNKLEVLNDLVAAARGLDLIIAERNGEEEKILMMQYGVFFAIRVIVDGLPKEGMGLSEVIDEGLKLAIDLS